MPFLKNLRLSSIAFFTDLFHSCYDMEWYRGIRARPLGESVRYSAVLFALFSALTMAVITPGMIFLVGDVRDWTDKNIPIGAEFRIEKGRFATTMPSPTIIKSETSAIVLDVGVTGLNFPDSAPKDTALLIGRDALFIRNSEVERRSFAFKDAPDFKTDRNAILGQIDKWGPWSALAILVFAGVGTFLGLVIADGLFVVITAAIVSGLARLSKVVLNFRQLVAVGLHALTLPLVIDLITGLFGLHLTYAFSFIYLMFLVAVLADERARPVKPSVA